VANEKSDSPTWIDVKAALQSFDRAGLLGLLQDLYAGSEDNKAFLHARLNLGRDQLKPYKTAISNWICPDPIRNKPVSVSKAKKAIAEDVVHLIEMDGGNESAEYGIENGPGIPDHQVNCICPPK